MDLNVDPLIEAIERYIEKADSDLEEQLTAEGYVAADIAVNSITGIEEEVVNATSSHVDEILSRIEAAAGVDDFIDNIWPEVSDAEELTAALYDIFYAQFNSLMQECVSKWVLVADEELADVIDTRITKPAEAFIKGWSQQLSELMNLSTKDTIEKILLTAQEEKQTIEEVAQAITDSGIREAGYKSRRVAVTEVLRVEEYAHQEARVQNPSCYKKSWVHTGEAQVPRENHVAINGQTVFKRECFTLVGRDGVTYHPICPRDTSLPASESINCHCRTDDIVDEDVLGMSLDERLALRQQYMDEVDAEYDAWETKFKEDYGIEEPRDDPSITWKIYNSYYEAYRRGEL